MQTIVYERDTGRVLSTADLRTLTTGDRLTINRTPYQVVESPTCLVKGSQGQHDIYVASLE